mmetsp:Transcript_58830/g.164278  ORF Transcript_58830/g.164278 Transcript_58830/m.164278 type:complete len:351 (-) Transcript_58830:129-1181(-)
MLRTGPEKTNVSQFKGFGFGAGTSRPGAPTASRPPSAAARARGQQAKAGVSSLFAESLEHDEDTGKARGLPLWAKPSAETLQAQRAAETLAAQDPSIFQYDEVVGENEGEDELRGSQAVRTAALMQKKRVGLTVREGSDAVRAGSRREAKYVEKVIIATDRRRVEQQIVEDRLLKKDKDKNQDCETFVTSGFKEELRRRKKFEDELEEQDRRDSQKAAEKMEHGSGFADMYRHLLNGGLATSRGSEKIREQAAPRQELPEDRVETAKTEEDVKTEIKDEAKEEIKVESEDAGAEHGVQDVKPQETPSAKRAREEAEKEKRDEKALSARERYLARKRAAGESAGAAAAAES